MRKLRTAVFLFPLLAFCGGMMPFKVLEDDYRSLLDLTQEGLVERYKMLDSFPTLEKIIDGLAEADVSGMSPDCLFDLRQYEKHFAMLKKGQSDEFTNAFINVLDSVSKIGPGILRGHKNHYGLYHQCLSIKHDFGNHTFKGNFVSYVFILTLQPRTPETCRLTSNVSLAIDLCMPESCQKSDLELVLNPLNFTCYFNDIRDQDRGSIAGTYITAVIMCLCLALGVTASIYDYYILPLHKNYPYTKSFGMKAWRSFSLYTNIVEIFNTKGSNKPGNIGPLHCMRFFSMIWVISGHTIAFFNAFSANPLDVIDITFDWGTQILTSAYYAVDTFFWQSGLLLSYIWFKKYHQNKRQSMSVFAWVMFYVHRIVRLSPPYYILIAFFTFIFSRKWNTGMPVYNHMPLDTVCDTNWWIDYLYLNNFIRYDKQCYLVSWYLSTDLQMYLFAPLVLIPFTFGPLYGIIVSLVIFGASTAVNVWTVVYHYFPPTDYSNGAAEMDSRMTVDYSFYTEVIYNAPWIRCQIYIIGLLTGYFLQRVKNLKIPFYVSIIGWIVTAGSAYGCIWSLKDWVSGQPIDIGYSALYSAISKVGWGIGLSWIVIACYYGYGGFVNSFMSWSIWVPLGRLTYSAYLIHICIVIYMNGINQQGLVFTNFTQLFTQFCIPCIVMSYLAAILWSSAFEFAFGKLEDAIISVLFGTGRRPPPAKVESAPAAANVEAAPNGVGANGTFEKATAPSTIFSDSIRRRNGEGALPTTDNSVLTVKVTKKDEAWS